jgi:hypothetical protein
MPSSRALHALDVALAIWVAVWLGLGIAIGVKVHDLTALSATVARDGRAVETVAGSLHSLGSVPLIGGQIAKDAGQVQQAGASAASSGARSASAIRVLSVLLGIAVAFLPTVPVLCLYLPARIQRRREAAALRLALARHGGDPRFHAFLARRAVDALGYHQLRAVSSMPWADVEGADCLPLAEAELRRLGLDPRQLHSDERSLR